MKYLAEIFGIRKAHRVGHLPAVTAAGAVQFLGLFDAVVPQKGGEGRTDVFGEQVAEILWADAQILRHIPLVDLSGVALLDHHQCPQDQRVGVGLLLPQVLFLL